MGVSGLWATLTKSHREVFTRIPLPPYTVNNITRSSLLEGRQLYVDATMFLYRFTASHNRLSMNQVMDRFSRLSFALKVLSGKRPVFVFDAKPSKIKKRHCLNQRWATRTAYAAAALAKVEKADSDEEEVIVPPRAAPAHMDARLGIWWTCMWRNFFARGLSLVRAPDGWDAEAVCAKLAARCNGVVVSEDGDALAFGAPAILRNVWRYRTVGVDEEPAAELVERGAVEEALGLTSEEFVELCVLAGCDFASRLPNLGFTVACRAIKEHGGIEEYLKFRQENDGDFRLVKLFALAFDWQAAIGCFQQDLLEDDLRCLVRTDQDRAIAATCLLYGAKGRLEEGVKRISSILNLCNGAVSRRVTNVLEPTLAPKAFFAANPWQQQFAYLTYTHVCRKNAIQEGIFVARDGLGMKKYVGGRGKIFDRCRKRKMENFIEFGSWKITRIFEPTLSLKDMPPFVAMLGPWRYRMAYAAREEAEAMSILRSSVQDTKEVKLSVVLDEGIGALEHKCAD